MTENNASNYLLSPLVEKGSSKFMSFVFHRYVERALWTFAELGIADLMANHEQPLTAIELSEINGNTWNAEFLYRLLRVVADINIVQQLTLNNEDSTESANPENELRFKLTDDGQLLTSNHPSRTRDLVRHSFSSTIEKPSAYLPDMIRDGYKNGTGFELAFGMNAFDYLKDEKYQQQSVLWSNAMSGHSNYGAASIASILNLSNFKVVVDIGGSFGTLLSFILKEHQNLFGIVLDLPNVIENAQARKPTAFEDQQIEPARYQFVSGDMFKSETIPVADVYIMKYILHDWDDEKSIEILNSIRLANRNCEPKTITLFIVEMLILSDDKSNWMARALDIEMIFLGGSKERTKREMIELLNKGGYEFKQLYQTNKQYSIIEATTTNTL